LGGGLGRQGNKKREMRWDCAKASTKLVSYLRRKYVLLTTTGIIGRDYSSEQYMMIRKLVLQNVNHCHDFEFDPSLENIFSLINENFFPSLRL
jgi:hypothetical protein